MLPNLSCANRIAIDLETCDPHLLEKGPGGVRKDGFIAGLAIGTDDGGRWYFPMRHERGANLPPEQVLAWARDELGRASQPKVGANLLYDCEWLACEGVSVAGLLWDVQIAEPLLDEHARVSLEDLATRYLNESKSDLKLNSWCADNFGGPSTRKGQAKNYWRAPPEIVAPYAKGDVDLPLKILDQQFDKLRQEGMEKLFNLESRLLPILLAMRIRGVRVNEQAAEAVLGSIEKQTITAISKSGVDVWSAKSIAAACDRDSIEYPRTPTGLASFTKEWMESQSSPLLQAVASARKLDKLRGTFLKGQIIDNIYNGRLHSSLHPLRGDEYGAAGGRLSSSQPNLQFIPKRDKVLGPLMRSLFLPDEGQRWVKHDYSQIEPRLQLHYARGPGADARKVMLRANPEANCYQEMMRDMGDVKLDYAQFKGVWLGISYGMGDAKMAAQLGVTKERAKEFRAAFPVYLRELADRCSKVAANRGHIKTLLGRYARFPLWESRDWAEARKDGAMPEDIARARYNGRVRRAHTYKALNRLAQGSAADVMKKAMVDVWESGACAVLGAPLLTVHDELDWSVPQTPEGAQALAEAKRIMETCVELRVPLQVDEKSGAHWGECD